MRLTLATQLFAQPIECGDWPQLLPTLDEDDAKQGRYARSSILLVESDDGTHVDHAFEQAAALLRTYQIFPPQRMRAKICSSSGEIAEGATIVQQIRVGAFAFEAAVRVTKMAEESQEQTQTLEFQYATLDGHPELGIAGFMIQQIRGNPNRLEFVIESWSQPGHWMTRFAAPFSRWMQVRSTEQALAHFKQALIESL